MIRWYCCFIIMSLNLCFLHGQPLETKLTASDGSQKDWFGLSVSISGDYAIVGAPADDDLRGAAYIFARTGNSWIEQAKLTPGDRTKRSYFGISVAISGDYVIIGEPGVGTGFVYIFIRNDSSWLQYEKLMAGDGDEYDYFGAAVSMFGDYAIVGASENDEKGMDAGAAYIFVRNDNGWNSLKCSTS